MMLIDDSDPIRIRLENIPPQGLGLSLGNGAAEEAAKNGGKSSVIVVDIKSTSPLPLQVGDELLEVSAFAIGNIPPSLINLS